MLMEYPSPTDSRQDTTSGHLQMLLQRCTYTLEKVTVPALTLLVTGHTLPPPGWEMTTSVRVAILGLDTALGYSTQMNLSGTGKGVGPPAPAVKQLATRHN